MERAENITENYLKRMKKIGSPVTLIIYLDPNDYTHFYFDEDNRDRTAFEVIDLLEHFGWGVKIDPPVKKGVE